MGKSWDAVARSYDRVSRESRAHRDKIERVAGLIRAADAKHVLDLGCGSGVLETRLYADGYSGRVSAVDGSAEMVRIARAASAAHPVEVEQRDLNAPLPFRDSEFDCAVAVNVLFLLEDPRAAVLEVKRVLQPRAPFLVVMPKPDTTNSTRFFLEHFEGLGPADTVREIGRLVVGLPAVIATARFQASLDAEHARTGTTYLTLEETLSVLEDGGFEVCATSDIQAGYNWLLECAAI